MPSTSFTHSAPISTEIETAWQQMQNIDTWAGIGPVAYAENPTHDDDGVLRAFDWGAEVGGKRYRGKARAVDWSDPDRFVLDMDTSEIRGRIEAVLRESSGGCEVTVTMSLSTKGMLSAMFFPAIKQTVATGFPEQVNALAAAM